MSRDATSPQEMMNSNLILYSPSYWTPPDMASSQYVYCLKSCAFMLTILAELCCIWTHKYGTGSSSPSLSSWSVCQQLSLEPLNSMHTNIYCFNICSENCYLDPRRYTTTQRCTAITIPFKTTFSRRNP